MESITYLKNIKVTPKKLRILLPAVSKMKPSEAAHALLYTQKKAAQVLYKAVRSAISNAKSTLKVDEDLLKFRVLTIEEGQKLKRYNPGSRGTAKPYIKRFSHIKIILTTTTAIAETKKTVKANEADVLVKKPVKKATKSKNEVAEVKVESTTKKRTVKKKAVKE